MPKKKIKKKIKTKVKKKDVRKRTAVKRKISGSTSKSSGKKGADNSKFGVIDHYTFVSLNIPVSACDLDFVAHFSLKRFLPE